MIKCPLCGHWGQLEDGNDDEDYYVWCEKCKQWFERGFQNHSGD